MQNRIDLANLEMMIHPYFAHGSPLPKRFDNIALTQSTYELGPQWTSLAQMPASKQTPVIKIETPKIWSAPTPTVPSFYWKQDPIEQTFYYPGSYRGCSCGL